MNKLQLAARPWQIFDPTNAQHRLYYAEFNRKGSWGTCPVRFVVTDDQGDLVTMIQRSLIKYYVDQEFARTRATRRKRAVKITGLKPINPGLQAID